MDLVALNLYGISTPLRCILQPSAEWNAKSIQSWTLAAAKTTICQVIKLLLCIVL